MSRKKQRSSHSISPGILYIVATPIGNLEDLSLRALRVLKTVDLILAEDTRVFSILSRRYEILTKVKSFHAHNEFKQLPHIIEMLQEGKNLALVSDAGTPLVSDPGAKLVSTCHEAGITVSSIPGPSAIITALAISGSSAGSFSFRGFLPHKAGKRIAVLTEAIDDRRTVIFFESPYRILKTLEDITKINPDRELFIARELTKMHEESLTGTAEELLKIMQSRNSLKGEFVLIIKDVSRQRRTRVVKSV